MSKVVNVMTGEVSTGPDVGPFRPTEEMVDAEAQRRTDAIFPAEKRDETSLHGVALLMKGQANWNSADLAAVAVADALWSQIEPIRAAAETIKAMDPIPDDYADNSRWP